MVGASQGIGKAIIEHWLEHPEAFPSYQVVLLCGRNTEALKHLEARIQARYPLCQVQCITQCITDTAQTAQTLLAAIQPWASLHWQCVCNAGICLEQALFTEHTLEEVMRTFQVNTLGVSAVIHTWLKFWSTTETYGDVLVVNSMAGLSSEPYWSAYSASKHALRALMEALTHERHPDSKVRFMSLYPGAVRTAMWPEEETHALQPHEIMAPEEVAQTIAWMLRTPSHLCVSQVTMNATQARL
ncbi:MAG: SDR family NAD(P)-dependent oxidoreductase [Vampirovibrionales bacterium]